MFALGFYSNFQCNIYDQELHYKNSVSIFIFNVKMLQYDQKDLKGMKMTNTKEVYEDQLLQPIPILEQGCLLIITVG